MNTTKGEPYLKVANSNGYKYISIAQHEGGKTSTLKFYGRIDEEENWSNAISDVMKAKNDWWISYYSALKESQGYMKPKRQQSISTLNEMINSEQYLGYEHDTINLQHRIINKEHQPHIITNQVVIDNWRDFITTNTLNLNSSTKIKIIKEINKVELYHMKVNTINDVVTTLE